MEKVLPILVTLFTSILLLITLFSVTPLSQLSSPILSKLLSPFSNQNTIEYDVLSSPISFDAGDVSLESMPPVNNFRDEFLSFESMPPENNFRDEIQVSEQDVVVLTAMNYSTFVADNQFVMINFYAPWCYFSVKLAPEYAAAATMLKGKAVLAKVDCTQEYELGRKFEIKGYPTMYFLVAGGIHQVLYDPREERTRDAIVNWVNQKINIAVQNLTTVEEAERILAAKPVVILGFLDSLEGSESEELDAVSKMHTDVDFYQTSNLHIARLFQIEDQIKRPALVLLKREDENHVRFAHEGQFTRSEIADFVSVNKVPSVITVEDDASDIFENPIRQLWLFAPYYGSCEALSIFKGTANTFKGKLLFVHVKIGSEGSVGRNLAYEFGVSEYAPSVVAYHSTNDGTKKYIYHGELTLSGIKSFAEEFLQGRLVRKTDTSLETVLRLPSHSHTSDPSSLPQVYYY